MTDPADFRATIAALNDEIANASRVVALIEAENIVLTHAQQAPTPGRMRMLAGVAAEIAKLRAGS